MGDARRTVHRVSIERIEGVCELTDRYFRGPLAGDNGPSPPASARRPQADEPAAQWLPSVELERLDGDEREPQALEAPTGLVRHRQHPSFLPIGLAQVEDGSVVSHLGDGAEHDLGLIRPRHPPHPNTHLASLGREPKCASDALQEAHSHGRALHPRLLAQLACRELSEGLDGAPVVAIHMPPHQAEVEDAGPPVRVSASVDVTRSEYRAVAHRSLRTSAGGAGTTADAPV